MNIERAINLYKNSLTNRWLVFFISMICCHNSRKLTLLNFWNFFGKLISRKMFREKFTQCIKVYTVREKNIWDFFLAGESNSGFSIREKVVFSYSGNSHSENMIPESVPTPSLINLIFKKIITIIMNWILENKKIIHYDIRSKSVLNAISYLQFLNKNVLFQKIMYLCCIYRLQIQILSQCKFLQFSKLFFSNFC